jgi:hypothetical protein
MIEKLTDLPAGILGLRVEGKITSEDYHKVVGPLVEEAMRNRQGIRAIVEFDSFGGMTPAALWTDVRLGVRALRHWTGCALLTDLRWARRATRFAAFFAPFPVDVFGRAERLAAIAWLRGLPTPAGIEPRLDPESGVVVVEADSPLGAPDIDALESTVDTWLAQHAELRGLVLHAPGVPGWRNVAGLSRHVRFVRDHQRHIRRVAVAVDGPVARFVPELAGRLMHPQVRHFGYDELDAARDWAGATR